MRARGEGPGAWDPRIPWTVALAALLISSCGSPRREPVTVTWVVGQSAPSFDPQGTPDPVRWAIERLLSRGLVEEDSTGVITPAAAESVIVSPDGLMYTFRIRRGLTFADGAPCGSEAFREALERGVNRLDHATYAWLLSAVEGMDQVRPGRSLPALGVATPDPRTLVLRLARPDSLLMRKLALPGVVTPWRSGSSSSQRSAESPGEGIGDYRVAAATPARLTLVRRDERSSVPDTIQVRFVPGAARVRVLLRAGVVDLLWPPPPDLLDRPLPQGYEARTAASRPPRRLLLIMRADLPPTSRAAARHALAHGLNREELLTALSGAGAEDAGELAGAAFDFPRHDPQEVQAWLERGKLGRSLHAVMAYSADGAGARIARAMQVEWARSGLDVELRELRQIGMAQEAIRRGGAQLLLVESQSLLDRPEAELAALVQPFRGPAVGAFRTGWASREFESWTRDPDVQAVALARQRLGDERVVLPLSRLPWLWVQRSEAVAWLHPHFGPDPRSFALGVLSEAR